MSPNWKLTSPSLFQVVYKNYSQMACSLKFYILFFIGAYTQFKIQVKQYDLLFYVYFSIIFNLKVLNIQRLFICILLYVHWLSYDDLGLIDSFIDTVHEISSIKKWEIYCSLLKTVERNIRTEFNYFWYIICDSFWFRCNLLLFLIWYML